MKIFVGILVFTAMILGLSTEASAQILFQKSFNRLEAQYPGTAIIPNPYKSKRSGHLTGAATVWNQRKSAGIEIENVDGKEKSGGSVDQEMDYFGYQPFLQVSSGNAGLEVRITKAEDELEGTTTGDFDVDYLDLKAGLLFSTEVAIGLNISKWDYDGDLGSVDQDAKGVNFVRKLDQETYIGGAYLETDSDGLSNENEYFSFGAGKVFGDIERPERAGEIYLVYSNERGSKLFQLIGKGVRNEGNTEYSADFQILRVSGSGSDSKVLVANVGLDRPYENIYFAPKFSYGYSDGSDSHGDLLGLQAEVGQRVDQKEYFFRLMLEQNDGRTSGASYEKEKDKYTTILAGFNTEF